MGDRLKERRRSHLKRQKGLTLMGLLIVIAVMAMVAAILLPVFARAREKARMARCPSNGKQIGTAYTWTDAIQRLKASLQANPRQREVELDLVWTLEQAGRAEEAAAYLRAHPRLWHGADLSAEERKKRHAPLPRFNPHDHEDAPGSVTADEVRQMIATGDRLVARAAFETSLQTFRCQVCHHRTPPLGSQPVTDVLFPDRKLLAEAVTVYTRARRFSTGKEAARLNYRIGRAQFKLSEIFPPKHPEAKQHLRAAQKSLGEALTQDPTNDEALNLLALSHMKLNETKRAAALWQRATKVKPGEARAWANLGTLYAKTGDAAKALALMQRAVALEPTNAALRTNLGLLYAAQGRVDDALREHRAALRLHPRHPTVRLNYALTLDASGDRAGAMRELREALKILPNSAAAHNALGLLLLQQGDTAQAMKEFQLAIKHNPAFAAAYRNLGILYRDRGERAEALKMFRSVLEWLPDDPHARAEVKRLSE
jgi:tetratricopeptide (TPR) repeat protein